MLDEKERIALYSLMEIPGMYPARLNAMFGLTGSFAELFSYSEKELAEKGIFKRNPDSGHFDELRSDPAFHDLCRKKYRRLQADGVRMIDYTEPDMPSRFQSLSDPPKVLFVKGSLPSESQPSVSIIGSRNCSEYGSSVARFFGAELSGKGVQIVSGMALGIDTAALEGGLEGTAGCFAVLGSGVNICYPSSSRTVYNRIRTDHGGILSEYVPDSRGIGYHFVTRNRLIAALGDALLVIEAREKSGTTITVENALEQGKEIFALPGRITDPLGYGCNRLIREGASVLTSPSDVLEYLGLESSGKPEKMVESVPSAVSEDEKKILTLLGPDPVHLEELAEHSGIGVSEAVRILSSLELSGAVRSTGNAYYVKCYRSSS